MKTCQFCGKNFKTTEDDCPYCHTDPTTGLPPKPKLSGGAVFTLVIGIGFILYTSIIFAAYVSHGINPASGVLSGFFVGAVIIYFSLKSYSKASDLYALAQNNPKEYIRQITALREKHEAATKKQAARREEELAHLPACPICGSKEHVRRISSTDRTVEVAVWGLGASTVGKQYECRKCNHAFNADIYTYSAPYDPAEEIRKYKRLLDDGIISQEEFDLKKKQILGL